MSNPKQSFVRDFAWLAVRVASFGALDRFGVKVLTVRAGVAAIADSAIELYPRGPVVQVDVKIQCGGSLEKERLSANPLRAWMLHKMAVSENHRFQAGVHGTSFYLAERNDDPPWQLAGGRSQKHQGSVVGARKNVVAISHPRTLPVLPRAIFAGTRAPGVWAHWLINYLPTVFLSRKLGQDYIDYPVLVPSDTPDDPHWNESLALVLEGREIVHLDNNSYVLVDDLVWIEAPVYDTPFSKSRTAGVALSRKPIEEFRDLFLTYASEHESGLALPTNVFLARKPKPGREYNQAACTDVAQKYGFEPVFVEDLSLADKIRLFRDARHIVGPGGSGFSNILFSGHETKGFSWWHKPFESTDNFELNLAAVGGSLFSVIPPSAFMKPSRGPSYEVCLDSFDLALKKLLNS
jgi:hypothetical protein